MPLGISTFFRAATFFLAIAVVSPAAMFVQAAPAWAQQTGVGTPGQPAPAAEPAAESTAAAVESPTTVLVTRALIEALRDEKARAAIILELEKMSPGGVAAASNGAETSSVSEPAKAEAAKPVSVGKRVALFTQNAAETMARNVEIFLSSASNASNVFAALRDVADGGLIVDALRDLFLVLLITYAVFWVLRAGARRIFMSLARTASEASLVRTIFLGLASLVIDAFVVVASWAAGYAITLGFFGEAGEMGLRQTLYLNAFLVVQIALVVMRTVLSPMTGELRFIPISDAAARYLYRRVSWLISILGYGHLLVVPLINQDASFLTGRAFSAAITLLVIFMAAGLVIRNRNRMAEWMLGEGDAAIEARGLRFLIRIWYVPFLVYLGWLVVSVISRPYAKLLPLLQGTGKVALAVLVGMAAMGIISKAIRRGVSLPNQINSRLPLLERRLNAFVPRILFALRLAVFLAIVAFALQVVGFFDMEGWLSSQLGAQLTGTIVGVAMIFLSSFLLWLALSSWVDYRLNPDFGAVATAREQTLLTLMRNAATIALIVITVMFVLSEIGIDIAPLIASAGVFGLAVGFGAQKLVQDIITGIFIQFENAVNVGDVITVSGTTGTVERLTIRSVSLRDVQGVYHIIPFSSVDMVSNYMRDFAYYVCDMGIAYREDIEDAKSAMMDAYEELRVDEDYRFSLIGDLEWFGLNAFGDNAVIVRARVKTRPGKQWSVGRAYNAILKRIFDERGIEIPFPHQTIYFGEDKKGNAPPIHVSVERGGLGAPRTKASESADAGLPPTE